MLLSHYAYRTLRACRPKSTPDQGYSLSKSIRLHCLSCLHGADRFRRWHLPFRRVPFRKKRAAIRLICACDCKVLDCNRLRRFFALGAGVPSAAMPENLPFWHVIRPQSGGSASLAGSREPASVTASFNGDMGLNTGLSVQIPSRLTCRRATDTSWSLTCPPFNCSPGFSRAASFWNPTYG